MFGHYTLRVVGAASGRRSGWSFVRVSLAVTCPRLR
jgi:hypothetical protein